MKGGRKSIISVKDHIEQEELTVRCQEGAKVFADISIQSGVFKAVSGGSINLKGKTNSQQITINSGGIFNGEELKSQDTKIKVIAGGEAEVYASKSMDAKVTAGGTVYVYGNPEKVSKKKSLGGTIVIKY